MSKAVDWIKIKNEYINTGISQRKLADKYDVSFSTLRDRANREKWAAAKQNRRNEIILKTEQRTAEKIIQHEVDRLTNILLIGDKLQEKVDEAIKQLTIYVDMFGEEHSTNVIDVSKLRKLVSSLKELGEIVKMAESNDKDIEKLDKLIEGISNAAKS